MFVYSDLLLAQSFADADPIELKLLISTAVM